MTAREMNGRKEGYAPMSEIVLNRREAGLGIV